MVRILLIGTFTFTLKTTQFLFFFLNRSAILPLKRTWGYCAVHTYVYIRKCLRFGQHKYVFVHSKQIKSNRIKIKLKKKKKKKEVKNVKRCFQWIVSFYRLYWFRVTICHFCHFAVATNPYSWPHVRQ